MHRQPKGNTKSMLLSLHLSTTSIKSHLRGIKSDYLVQFMFWFALERLECILGVVLFSAGIATHSDDQLRMHYHQYHCYQKFYLYFHLKSIDIKSAYNYFYLTWHDIISTIRKFKILSKFYDCSEINIFLANVHY